MALLYRPYAFYRENAMFHLSAWKKTNTYFVTKLGRRDYVGKIYKLTKFGKDRFAKWRLHVVVKYNGFVTFFSRLFFRFLDQPTGRNFGPNCTLNGSKVVLRLIHVPFGVWRLQIYYEGSTDRKTAKFWPLKVWTSDFLQKIALTLEPLRVNYH